MLKRAVDCVEMSLIRWHNKFIRSERGDTNFISILIVLAIVILLVGLFIGFKDEIVKQVDEIVGDFKINSPTGVSEP